MSAQKEIAELKQEVGTFKGLLQSAIDLFKGGKQEAKTEDKPEDEKAEDKPAEGEETTVEETPASTEGDSADAGQITKTVADLTKQVADLKTNFEQSVKTAVEAEKKKLGTEAEQAANKAAAAKIRSATSTPLAQANDEPGKGKPAAQVDAPEGLARAAAALAKRRAK